MSIINTQGGIGTAFIWWTNFVNWAVQGSAESWWRLNDPSLAEHLGTCLTLITACSTDFTAPKLLCWNPAPWLRSCLSSLTCKLWQIKGKTSWKRLWPSGCLSYPCDGDYSSARQVNEWLLKHIKLNSNWRQNTPSWKAGQSRSCLLSCVVVSAVAGWELPSGGDGGDGPGHGTTLAIGFEPLAAVRPELLVPSLTAWLFALCCWGSPAFSSAQYQSSNSSWNLQPGGTAPSVGLVQHIVNTIRTELIIFLICMWHECTWVMYSTLYINHVYTFSPNHVCCSIFK